MRFCKECDNLLYPRENKLKKQLEYACKSCETVEVNIK